MALSLSSCGKEGGDDPKPTVKVANVKVMSFNLRSASASADTGTKAWASRRTAVQTMMNQILPDVVGMQEAYEGKASENKAMRTDLKTLLPDYAMLVVPGTGTSQGGNTVIMYNTTTLEMKDYKSFYLSKTPDTPSPNGWNSETQHRTTIWAEFKHKESGIIFHVADTHMPLYNTPEGITARTNSAKLNIDRLKPVVGDTGPIFILGDMNCSTKAAGLQNYYDWMNNAREMAPQTDTKLSFNNYGGGSNSNLDHIFYRNVTVSSFKTLDDNYGVPYISDHYPILVKATIISNK